MRVCQVSIRVMREPTIHRISSQKLLRMALLSQGQKARLFTHMCQKWRTKMIILIVQSSFTGICVKNKTGMVFREYLMMIARDFIEYLI